jgi:hypothetical protein
MSRRKLPRQPIQTHPPINSSPRSLDQRRVWVVAISLFLFSAFIRVLWIYAAQFPGDAMVSDMAGYMARAQALLDGNMASDRYLAVYPFGTHYVFALLMRVFGEDNLAGLAVAQALMGAACPALMFLTAQRAFGRLGVSLALGVILSLWQPWIVFVGYFSSETPYLFFMTLSLWSTVRWLQTHKGGLMVGASSAIAFVIRPQMLLYIIMASIYLGLRRRGLGLNLKQMLMALLPVLLVVGFSVWRYHSITGDWHVISDNGAIGRFFADTRYMRIESIETFADGHAKRRFFQPPATKQIGQTERFQFHGYIADATILDAERRRVQSTMSLAERWQLVMRNVRLLVAHNEVWPEMQIGKDAWRQALQRIFSQCVLWIVVPLAVVGFIAGGRRAEPAVMVAGLHVVTMLYAAAVYFGETRYRIPYDGVLLFFALIGAIALTSRSNTVIPPSTSLPNHP